MSDISDRYRRLADHFATIIAATPQDRWSAPSPCEDWTATDVVTHVVDAQAMFLGLVGRTPVDAPPAAEQPLAAFRAVSAQVLADLEDPERAAETFEGFAGTSRFDVAVDRSVSFDLVVHGWDLARATGGDETIDPAEAERLLTVDVPAFGDMLHAPGVCGPALPVAEDAPVAQRLLAELGRSS